MNIDENIKPYAKALIEKLKSAGATAITVSFDGSGDSGSVTGVDITGGKPAEDKTEWLARESRYQDGKWINEYTAKEVSIEDALENLCYELLEETGIDWYNNDGGFGELEITLDPIEITLNVNTRYTEYNTDSFELEEL